MLKTLKAFSLILGYPNSELQQALPEISALIKAETVVADEYKLPLQQWLANLASRELISWQEDYVALFDNQVSLYLFEYVHGQSRERGQAMVDLSGYYQTHNFAIAGNELPDYLPLVLEFLSYQPAELVREFLADMLGIIGKIGQKLRAGNSDYALICENLEIFMGQTPQITKPVIPIKSLAEIDKDWAESPVTFGSPHNSCGNCQTQNC